MRRGPSNHCVLSHAALLDQLVRGTRHWFAGAVPAWDPAEFDHDARTDHGRALLDCYALALHVLWTYQHAWADEGFLSTARLPASTRRLLELIGYRPDAGIAATGLQHFRCKENQSTTLSPGFAVRANAEGDKQAAEFETLSAVRVSSALNELRAFLPQPATEPISTTGAIAAAAELTAPEISVPPPQGVFDGDSFVGQLADRLSAARGGLLAQRNAARARQKALQLAEVAKALQEQGAEDICAQSFQSLCEQLCQAQALANQVANEETPGPPSESQELLVGQLAKLANRRPDAIDAMEQALARQPGESDEDWSSRLDQTANFLDALVAGIFQEARDQVVRLRGGRALTQLDRAYAEPRTALDRPDLGVAAPGQDSLYLVPNTRDPDRGPQTQSGLLRPGDWLVVGEDLDRVGPDGEVQTLRRYREAIRIQRVGEEIPEGQREPMTRITFKPALSRRYHLSRTVLLGNIAEISHGSTVVEEGADLAPEGQSIRLSQGPLTWLRDVDPSVQEGRVPQVELRVADQEWTRVNELQNQDGSGADFAVEVTPEGDASLRVGDGREGATVPAGASLSIRYRVGVGDNGNRSEGAITELADADPAIVATFNPLTVSGGVESEDPELAQLKAAAGIHSLNRAISVADVRSLALTFGRVRRARVFRDPVRRREHLTVVVSGEHGEALTDQERGDLRTFLVNRMPPGASVAVDNRILLPVRASLRIQIKRGSDPIQVIRQIRIRLGVDEGADEGPGLLHPDRADLGRDVHLSDFYGALSGIDNLCSVFVERLHRADSSPTRNDRIIVAPREMPVWAKVAPGSDPLEIRWEEARDL